MFHTLSHIDSCLSRWYAEEILFVLETPQDYLCTKTILEQASAEVFPFQSLFAALASRAFYTSPGVVNRLRIKSLPASIERRLAACLKF